MRIPIVLIEETKDQPSRKKITQIVEIIKTRSKILSHHIKLKATTRNWPI